MILNRLEELQPVSISSISTDHKNAFRTMVSGLAGLYSRIPKDAHRIAFGLCITAPAALVTVNMMGAQRLISTTSFGYPLLLAVGSLVFPRIHLITMLGVTSATWTAISLSFGEGQYAGLLAQHQWAQLFIAVLIISLGALFTRYVSKTLRNEVARLESLETANASLRAMEEHQATHDTATGLPNCRATANRAHALLKAGSSSQTVSCVILVALDSLSQKSMLLSQQAVDDLLRQYARRIVLVVGPDVHVGYSGGYRFTVVLSNIEKTECAIPVAAKILEAIREPLVFESRTHLQTCSIGIASSTDASGDFESMCKMSAQAVAGAINAGGDILKFYEVRLNSHLSGNVDLRSALLSDISRENITLHYQPTHSLQDEKLIGVEAKMRWHHHSAGLIESKTLISIASANSLMYQLEEWALSKVVQQIADWKETPLRDIVVSAAITPTLIRRGTLVSFLQSLLERYRVRPNSLRIEIEESDFADFNESEIECIKNLNDLGVQTAIHNFGYGSISFKTLAETNIQKIKLSPALTLNCIKNQKELSIVEATVAAAAALGMPVEAAGVNSEEIKAAIALAGCVCAQGATYSPAVPAEEIEMMVMLSREHDIGVASGL